MNNRGALPNMDVGTIAPPLLKRPRLSPERPAPTSAPSDSSRDTFEALRGLKLTRAQVDYWHWKYEEISQFAAALMPSGLLSLAPMAPGQFPSQPPAAWGPQLDCDADWELAYEINMDMGLLPQTSGQGSEASSSRSGGCDDALASADCGGALGTNPPSVVAFDSEEGHI